MKMLCLPAIAAGVVLAGPARASDLSYTFVDVAALNVDSSAAGMQSMPQQVVEVDLGSGDGLRVAGSLAFGGQYYLAGSFQSAVMDVDATVSSPLASESVSGNFDLVTSRIAVGYLRPFGENLDLVADVSYDSVEYDFGSFAGESFDMRSSGLGATLGLRWNPRPTVEVFASASASAVGDADLTARALGSSLSLTAGVRYYIFEELGFGFAYEAGDVDVATFSMRFGFGDLGIGERQ